MFKEGLYKKEFDKFKINDINKKDLESILLKEINIIEKIKELGRKGFFELGPEFDPENRYTKIEILDNINSENLKNIDIDNYKKSLKKETSWSDKIIDNISSIEEGEIYRKSGLREEEINGRSCLVKENIDLHRPVDPLNRTNIERMQKGLSPIDKSGEKIELHHIGQKSDGPLVELTQSEHRGKESDGILHDKNKESEINRNKFNSEKMNHWNTRVRGS